MRSATTRNTITRNAIPPLLCAVVGLAAVGLVAGGCRPRQSRDRDPAPRVDIPPRDYETPVRERDEIKPLPERSYGSDVPPPPFDDVPLLNQRLPEQKAFVDAYEAMGRPRIVVFVNRTLEGELVPVNPGGPLVSVERRRSTRGDVSVESRDYRDRDDFYRGRDGRERVDRFETRGPGEYRETAEVYLRPGEYDEVDARALDYETMENILIDWLAAGGRVELISPLMARQRLSDQQVKELQEGRPQAMSEAARQLDADVLVQVQARPTRQTPQGLAVRVIAEAINVRGGQSIGRGIVDVPPPLDKPQLNKYTRFLARRLMDGMTGSWRALASDRGREREQDRDAERLRDRGASGARPSDDRAQDDRQNPRRTDAEDARRPDPRRDDPRPNEPGADDSRLQERSIVDAPSTRGAAPTTRPSAAPDSAPAGPEETDPPAGDNK